MMRTDKTTNICSRVAVASLAIAVSLVIGEPAFADEPESKQMPLTVYARTGFNPPTGSGMEPRTAIIRDRQSLILVFGEAASKIDEMLGQPRIDFDRYMVICVASGKQPSSGYRVAVQSVVRKREQGKSNLVVHWVLRKPKGYDLAVITSPSELLLVERNDGDPIFEQTPETKESVEKVDPGRASADDWRALLKYYQSLGLPLPPADAPLVARLCEMELIQDRDTIIPLHRPKYLLGFLVYQNADKTQILVGTNLIDIDPDQARSVVRVDPAKDLPGELMMADADGDFQTNAGLPAAIQCYQRGWQALADRLLALQAKAPRGYGSTDSPFFQPPGWRPEMALKFLAWAHYGNQLARPTSDRKAVLKQLQQLSAEEPILQSPECWGLINALTSTVAPSRAAAGSAEELVDGLVNLDAALWGDTFMLGLPKPLVSLARRGWEAMPTLISHIGDRRLTRSLSRSLDGAALRLVTVGEVVGTLVQQSTGDTGASWIRHAETHQLRIDQVNAWWKAAKQLNESDYLIRAAVPLLPKATRTYAPIVERLAFKYPKRLSDIYEKLLSDRPDVNSRDLVRAIETADLSRSEKISVIGQGVKSTRVARQTEALEALARLDQRVFEVELIRSLKALPASTPNRYADSEQTHLAQLCWETNSLDVWHVLRDSVLKADVGVRMEIIGQITDRHDLSATRRRRVAEFLLAFFEDETIRDVATSPEKYERCSASSWRRIEVRNFAAHQLAKYLGLDVSKFGPERAVGPIEWQELRSRVAEKCEERRITPDYPSPEEERQAKEALRALGVLIPEPSPRSERTLTTISLTGLDIKDTDLRHLRHFPDLEVVEVANTPITNEGLRELARCKKIQVLDLANTKITDVGLEHLGGFKSLRGLDLSQTAVTDRGMQRLVGLGQLRHLNLNDTKITNAGMEFLAKLPSLDTLTLRVARITDAGLNHLTNAPRLATLDVTGTGVTDAGLKMLGKCDRLESLTLSLTNVTDAGLEHLSKLSRLRRLYLFGLPITNRGADAIGKLRGLTFLSLSSKDVTDEGIKSLALLEDLDTLYLSQTGITDQGVLELKALKKLVRLGLSDTVITDQSVATLRTFSNLKSISLSGTKVTTKGKEELKRGNPRLEVY